MIIKDDTLPAAEIQRIADRVTGTLAGEEATIASYVLLRLWFYLAKRLGATRDEAEAVLLTNLAVEYDQQLTTH